MDIEYLLILQNFREATNNILSPFFLFISNLSVDPKWFLVYAFFYWTYNKKLGEKFFFNFVFFNYILNFIKMIVCAYRPWIKDSRVLPYGNSKNTATGYSFPSGHTINAVSIYGTYGIEIRKKKPIIFVCSIILMILTMFSRNYLGVHTPQDVIVGVAMGLIIAFITDKIWDDISDNIENVNKLYIAMIIFIIVTFFIITFKPYRMDYIDNKLIADPEKMKMDYTDTVYMNIAFLISFYIEKKYIKFLPYEKIKNKKRRMVLAIIGVLLGLLLIIVYEKTSKCSWFPFVHVWGMKFTVLIIFLMLIWPLVIKFVEEKNKIDFYIL